MGDDEHEHDHAVRVYIRFRPIRDIEDGADTDKTFGVEFDGDGRSVRLTQRSDTGNTVERSLTFDRVFEESSSQEQVFNSLARSTVDDVVRGFNGTIFAYGQTGSGKTHSMFGEKNRAGKYVGDLRGIIPRAAEYLFEEVQSSNDIQQVTIKCSFLEIYKERFRDLLNPGSTDTLKIRETPRGAVKVMGLVEEYVSCPDDILGNIALGEKSRAVSTTDMNERSSRSHTVLTITVTEKLEDGSIRIGKLHLADLAGSERADKSGLVGTTLSEAKKINQSLSALGNCINALTDSKRSHIPFRDSKLTYFLKDSLGGNTKTSLLVTCSPHAANSDETLSSLKFAQRASHVKNQVKINKQLSVNELQALVQKLRRQLAHSKTRIKKMERGDVVVGDDDDEDEAEVQASTKNAVHARARARMKKSQQNITLPTKPQEAADLYAAYGSSALGKHISEQEEKLMSMAERGVLLRQTMQPRPWNGSLRSSIDLSGFTRDDFPSSIDESISGYGTLDGRSSSMLAQNSLAVKQRLLMKQRLYSGLQHLNGSDSARTYDEYSSSQAPDTDDSVVQRAKDAIRRSLASRPSGEKGGSDNVDDDDELGKLDPVAQKRLLAKKHLQAELAAAKRRRETLRSVQRKRADGRKGDASDLYRSQQKAIERDLESMQVDIEERLELEKELALPHKGNAKIVTGLSRRQEPVVEVDDPDDWSPVNSPIPPPPSVHPISLDDQGVGTSSASQSMGDASTLKRKAKTVHRNTTTGMVEFRVDLCPDKDHEPDGQVTNLGYVELKDTEISLGALRMLILTQLEDAPKNFIFTRKGVPIGLRQEKKRKVSYVVTNDDTIQLRIDYKHGDP